MKASQNGFTLLELMVAMAAASVVMAAIFATYHSQVRSHASQQAVVEMQQHARAALYLMEREIRMAGNDPTGYARARIITADPNYLHFTMDITGGDPGNGDSVDNDRDGRVDEPDEWYNGGTDDENEEIEYRLRFDADADGVSDGPVHQLVRQTAGAGGFQTVAENIEALNFVYLGANGNPLPAGFDPDDIRSIQVTLIARSDNPVLMRQQTDRNQYLNQQGATILDLSANPDNIRRIILTTEIRCRNMGLDS